MHALAEETTNLAREIDRQKAILVFQRGARLWLAIRQRKKLMDDQKRILERHSRVIRRVIHARLERERLVEERRLRAATTLQSHARRKAAMRIVRAKRADRQRKKMSKAMRLDAKAAASLNFLGDLAQQRAAAAARLVQARQRTRMNMHRLKQAREGALLLQRDWRGVIGRREAAFKRMQLLVAVRMQAFWRGWRIRCVRSVVSSLILQIEISQEANAWRELQAVRRMQRAYHSYRVRRLIKDHDKRAGNKLVRFLWALIVFKRLVQRSRRLIVKTILGELTRQIGGARLRENLRHGASRKIQLLYREHMQRRAVAREARRVAVARRRAELSLRTALGRTAVHSLLPWSVYARSHRTHAHAHMGMFGVGEEEEAPCAFWPYGVTSHGGPPRRASTPHGPVPPTPRLDHPPGGEPSTFHRRRTRVSSVSSVSSERVRGRGEGFVREGADGGDGAAGVHRGGDSAPALTDSEGLSLLGEHALDPRLREAWHTMTRSDRAVVAKMMPEKRHLFLRRRWEAAGGVWEGAASKIGNLEASDRLLAKLHASSCMPTTGPAASCMPTMGVTAAPMPRKEEARQAARQAAWAVEEARQAASTVEERSRTAVEEEARRVVVGAIRSVLRGLSRDGPCPIRDGLVSNGSNGQGQGRIVSFAPTPADAQDDASINGGAAGASSPRTTPRLAVEPGLPVEASSWAGLPLGRSDAYRYDGTELSMMRDDELFAYAKELRAPLALEALKTARVPAAAPMTARPPLEAAVHHAEGGVRPRRRVGRSKSTDHQAAPTMTRTDHQAAPTTTRTDHQVAPTTTRAPKEEGVRDRVRDRGESSRVEPKGVNSKGVNSLRPVRAGPPVSILAGNLAGNLARPKRPSPAMDALGAIYGAEADADADAEADGPSVWSGADAQHGAPGHDQEARAVLSTYGYEYGTRMRERYVSDELRAAAALADLISRQGLSPRKLPPRLSVLSRAPRVSPEGDRGQRPERFKILPQVLPQARPVRPTPSSAGGVPVRVPVRPQLPAVPDVSSDARSHLRPDASSDVSSDARSHLRLPNERTRQQAWQPRPATWQPPPGHALHDRFQQLQQAARERNTEAALVLPPLPGPTSGGSGVTMRTSA